MKEKRKKSFTYNDKLLIKFTNFFLFPLYFVGLLLKFYDSVKVKIFDFVIYKILKRKKENKVEDWWII